MSEPELSVVVAIQPKQGSHFQGCLQSLTNQQGISSDECEIIAVAEPSGFDLATVSREFPQVVTIPQDGATSLPLLHAAGIAAAKGKLVAVTEGHCNFESNWAARAIAHHQKDSAPVIAGSVEPGEELSLLDWALFFCDYGQFLPPLDSGQTHDVPGNNIVFKAPALGEKQRFVGKGFWKTFFCHDLEQHGQKLICKPDLVVSYNRHLSLGQVIARRYHHGRCFGGMRAAESSFSKRLIYALAGPVLPLLLLYKLCLRMGSKPNYGALFLASLPFSLLCLTTWALGEWLGNLLGASDSCERL
jgi:hypothetical protein